MPTTATSRDARSVAEGTYASMGSLDQDAGRVAVRVGVEQREFVAISFSSVAIERY